MHQLAGATHTLRLGYRFYRDDWGVTSNTATVRFRYAHLADEVPRARTSGSTARAPPTSTSRASASTTASRPVLPESGHASADYRLDDMRSTTVGLKYGMAINARTDFRVRAELLDQRFDVAEPDALRATIFQASLRYRF